MYDFSMTEEQHAIFDMARDFGATNIEPHAVAWDPVSYTHLTLPTIYSV